MIPPTHSALGLLRLLLAASIVAPIVLVIGLGWFTWHTAYDEAERETVWTSGIAREHAMRVFDAQELVTERVFDLVNGMSDEAIRADEQALHLRLQSIVADLPQFLSVIIVDRAGRLLVASGAYPVSRDIDMSDRDYFLALRAGGVTSFVSDVHVSRVDGRTFFGLARVRRDAANSFAGLVNIAISPEFFTTFYAAMVKEDGGSPRGRILAMVKASGPLLVRYPAATAAGTANAPSPAFSAAVARDADTGLYRTRSVGDAGAPERLYAYRKVGDYPLYVVAGRSVSAIAAEWGRRMLLYLAAIVPATAALVFVTLETVRLARREDLALAQARDEIRRRQIAEEALRRAQRLEAVGQLTGGIAHDFNNLLTIIMGNVDMMVRRAGDAERVKRLGANVLAAAKRVADVTDKLLAFSRRHVVKPEVVCANSLLSDLRPLLGRAVSETVTIELRLSDDVCAVRVDAGQLEAAVINLVVNARDAMPEGGRLTLSTSDARLDRQALEDAPDLPEGRYLRLVVSDTGSGMDRDTAAKAFEPFFTTKGVGKGTGLGLSQVYGFAKQAGGHVRIHSAPGEGTAVEILLPCSLEPVVREDRGSDAAAEPALARGAQWILVVEDEPDLRDMAVESLRDLGYRTVAVADAAEALAVLRGPQPVDLLFSDVVMPGGMNGIGLLHEARRLRPRVPVLLTSGYATDDIPDDVRLLQKPYVREDLAAEVGRLLVQHAPA